MSLVAGGSGLNVVSGSHGRVTASDARSVKVKTSARRRRQGNETTSTDGAASVADGAEPATCEEAEPESSWSPECWDERSSVNESLPQCNCLGPMHPGA